MAEREGQQLGNYRLLNVLGEGGFAQVYLGEHVYLKTPAAIKVLNTRLGKEELEGFQAEAQTIARLVHPQIVRVLEFGVEQGTPYLVMDYAQNGSLRGQMRRGAAQPPAAIAPAIKQVAEALQYAHDQRLIHRDVKPENILLGRNGEFLLSDFGIATVAQTTSQQRTQGFAGTAAYAAPEQLQGKPVPASDQYALAIVAYEWLTGATPFQGAALEIATQQIVTPPPPLRERAPTLSPAVEQVVLTALAKNPKDRFGSVRAFANAFDQACQLAPGVFPVAGPQPTPANPPMMMPPQPTPAPGDPIYSAPTYLTPPGPPAGGVSSPETPTFVTPPGPPTPPIPTPTPPTPFQTPPQTPGWRVSDAGPPLSPTFQPPPPGGYGPPYRPDGPPVQYVQGQPPAPPHGRGKLVAGIVAVVLVVALIGGIAFSKGLLGGNTQTGGSNQTPVVAGATTPPRGITPTNTPVINRLCNGQISIATDLPTTGTDGSEGHPAQNAVQLAVNQANLGGGYTLSLIPYNDVSAAKGSHDPVQGAQNVTQMVANPCILGMVGPFNSSVAVKEIPISENNGLVMISPANTNPGLTIQATAAANGIDWNTLHPKGGNPETYFRIPGNDVFQGAADADLSLSLNARRAYVVDDQETYGVGLANYFTTAFQAKGGTILGRDGIPANGAAQIPGLAAKIVGFKPDVVFFGGLTSTGGGTLKAQLVQAGYTGPMVSGDGIVLDPAFIQQAGSAANGTYASNSAPDPSALTSSAALKFKSDYTAAFPNEDTGAYRASSFDAANIIITAIKNIIASGKDVTRAAVITGVQNIQYTGVTGRISFDVHGDNASGGIWAFYKVQSGQWVFLKQAGG